MSKVIGRENPGFFDSEERMAALSEKGYPLQKLNRLINWEMFRADLDRACERPAKGAGGRPHYDRVTMFKVLVIQRFYNLSDEEAEFQINDRATFQSFLGFTQADRVPDATTIWSFREELGKGGGVENLFQRFDRHLSDAGLTGKTGCIVDASFVEVPKQRNSREENEMIKAGSIPTAFEENPNRLSQKDTEARWTKKGEEVHFGYKNHVKASQKMKLIETYAVTDASVHDSQVVDDLVAEGDAALHGDSAYRSEKVEAALAEKGIVSEIHERAYRGRATPAGVPSRQNKRRRIGRRAAFERG